MSTQSLESAESLEKLSLVQGHLEIFRVSVRRGEFRRTLYFKSKPYKIKMSTILNPRKTYLIASWLLTLIFTTISDVEDPPVIRHACEVTDLYKTQQGHLALKKTT